MLKTLQLLGILPLDPPRGPKARGFHLWGLRSKPLLTLEIKLHLGGLQNMAPNFECATHATEVPNKLYPPP